MHPPWMEISEHGDFVDWRVPSEDALMSDGFKVSLFIRLLLRVLATNHKPSNEYSKRAPVISFQVVTLDITTATSIYIMRSIGIIWPSKTAQNP